MASTKQSGVLQHILIIDDNPFNRQLLRSFLQIEGCSVQECRSGKEAMELLHTESFDMIFTDILMPGMDGFETIRRIRDMGIRTPIITTSSMTSAKDRQRSIEAGSDDFMPKPIQIAQVRELIRKYSLEINGRSGNKTVSLPSFVPSEYHILLIEEDEKIAARYQQFFKTIGFRITHVHSGDKALELLQLHKQKHRIVISNVFTSGIDGMGILVNIKRNYPDTMVFIYAAEYDSDTFQMAIRCGADGILLQSRLEYDISGMIESAVYRFAQKSLRNRSADTSSQVRKAQANLIRLGCTESCNAIDIAYSQLTDAGGDMALCRRFNIAGRCGIVLGDVAGHNIMSSYISAIFLGILSSIWDKHQNPSDLLRNINTELNKADYSDYHLCASAALWDRQRRTIRIATAGNPGGLRVKKEADGSLKIEELEGGGLCLGMLKEGLTVSEYNISFDPDNYLFLFSDGIQAEEIIEILHSTDLLAERKTVKGVSQFILDRISEYRVQEDDMILVTLHEISKAENSGLHYSFLSSYKGADEACQWAAEKITQGNVPDGKDSVLILLAIREALINAVRYGNSFSPRSYVDLSLYFSEHELRADISDEGPGFDLPSDLNKIEHIHASQLGNRGLAAMNSIADRIEVYGGTVSLIFKKGEPDERYQT